MCVTRSTHALGQLRATATTVVASLASDGSQGEQLALQLSNLLTSGRPVLAPLPSRCAEQISPLEVLRREVHTYPTLLEHLVGPPLQVGPDEQLAHVLCECALSALRSGDVQGTVAMLFSATLCTSRCSDLGAEVLSHLLDRTDRQGSFGLLAVGERSSGLGAQEMSAARRTMTRSFAVMSVQLLGVWDPPGGTR